MHYIYKYVNRETNDVEYVGITNDMQNRVDAHKRETWYAPLKYTIYYAECNNQSEAEALESHYIEFYGSGDFYNKRKVGWGMLSFAPDVEWMEWDPIPTNMKDIKRNRKAVQAEERMIALDMSRLEHRQEMLFRRCAQLDEYEVKCKRKSIRDWFGSVLAFAPLGCGKYAPKGDLYKAYCEYCDHEEKDIMFENCDDFWDSISEMYEYRSSIKGDKMFGILPKEEAQRMFLEQDNACEKMSIYYKERGNQ